MSDNRFVISGFYDTTLKLWNIINGTCVRTFQGHDGSITTVSISNDDKYVISAAGDNTLKLWNLSTGECARNFTGLNDTF